MPKCVILGVPHTTNWDLATTLAASWALQIPAVFMMKDSWFKGTLAPLFYWLGGVPVNRRGPSSTVQQMVDAINEADQMYVVIAPQGTRKGGEHPWKLGFYWIARGANIPLLPGFVDYKNKRIGVGEPLYLTGDLEQDFTALRNFYGPKVNHYPTYTPPKPAVVARITDTESVDSATT